MNSGGIIYLLCVLVALFAYSSAVVIVAKKTHFKGPTVGPLWIGWILCLAMFVAGIICSIIERDIRIFYWSLFAFLLMAISFPLAIVFSTLFARALTSALCSLHEKFRSKK